jgi:hypothetical protein
MTAHDRDPLEALRAQTHLPHRNPPDSPSLNAWLWAVGIGSTLVVVAVVVGLTTGGSQTAANPPAVIAMPSALPGVPPPAPQLTRGQSSAPQTTGQGSAR